MHNRHFDLFKQLYYDEIITRDRIWNMITGYLTSMPLLVTGFIFFATKVKDFESVALKNTCYIFVIIIMLIIMSSVFCCVRALFGYGYQYLSSPADIEKHTQSLIDHYQGSFTEEMAKKATYENYRNFASNNSDLNKNRLKWIVRAFRLLAIALCLSALLIIPYLFFKKDDVQKIKIVKETSVGGSVYGQQPQQSKSTITTTIISTTENIN